MATATSEAPGGTTVELDLGNGHTTGPVPLEEFGERIGRARDGMRRGNQLSFDVGSAGGSPDFATLKVAGELPLARDLKRQVEVIVTVSLDDGTVLTTGRRKVTGVHFKDVEDKHGAITTTRIHTVG
jgi:hypothetical protein